jgi:hypothetical protein
MQRDSHYYAVLAFARGSGFKKESALTLAYASQFVDDAKINHIIVKGKHNEISGDIVEEDPDNTHFLNMATCHGYFKLKTMNFSSMTNNTCAFHFVPGCEGHDVARKFRCMPDGKVIRDILDESLLDDDVVKFGMVLHAYADSFSHQGFAGIPSKVNDIVMLKSLEPKYHLGRPIDKLRLFIRGQLAKIDQAIPPYGHAQALTYPDMAHLVWTFKYDNSKNFTAVDREDYPEHSDKETKSIYNEKRYVEAFNNIASYLEKYLNNHARHKDDKNGTRKLQDIRDKLFDTLLKRKMRERSKEKEWLKVLKAREFDLFDDDEEIEYAESKWLEEAFENYNDKKFNHRTVDGALLREEFEKSNWYNFYNAVKWYKPRFYKYCKKYGLNIPNDYLTGE